MAYTSNYAQKALSENDKPPKKPTTGGKYASKAERERVSREHRAKKGMKQPKSEADGLY